MVTEKERDDLFTRFEEDESAPKNSIRDYMDWLEEKLIQAEEELKKEKNEKNN